MPNREDKKHNPKKKRDLAFKKSCKGDNHLVLKKVKDISEIHSPKSLLTGSSHYSTLHINDNVSYIDNSISVLDEDSHLGQYSSSFGAQYENKLSHSPHHFSKRRYSKPSGSKFSFFPFLKKSADSNIPIQSTPNIVEMSSTISPKCKHRNYSTGDSSQCSINSNFNSGNSLFAGSQYLHSHHALNHESPNELNSDVAISPHSSSYLLQNFYSSPNENPHIRPNSIAFPLTPLPQSTINLPTTNESYVRHSIATMPHTYELSQIPFGNQGIQRIRFFESQFTEKCISSPSLENSDLWSPIIPSHPDYPQIAKDMMHCSKSLTKEMGYFLSGDLKRQSLPSDADSGVVFDHHKRSMVFSGYNSLLSIEPSTTDLSFTTQNEYDVNHARDSAHSSNEFSLKSPDSRVFSFKDRRDQNHLQAFNYTSVNSVCLDSRLSRSPGPTFQINHFYAPCLIDSKKPFLNSDEVSSSKIQESFSTSLQNIPNHSCDIIEYFEGNDFDLQRNREYLQCKEAANFENFHIPHSTRYIPRRTKSLKDSSKPSQYPNKSENSLAHERDVSFYTYIAPDPNHAKEIPFWLESYSNKQSNSKFDWKSCYLDDLICWNTLLGRLYKKELEGLIKLYEDCREDLIIIINERREDLVGERIALENALMSEETYV